LSVNYKLQDDDDDDETMEGINTNKMMMIKEKWTRKEKTKKLTIAP